MFGVVNFVLFVLSVGCLTLALPLEKKQRNFEPQLTYEVIKHGPPCETRAQMDDDVQVILSSFTEVGDEVERGFQLTLQFKLGDAKMPGLDEALVGMCPQDIRRLSYDLSSAPADRRYGGYFEAELVSIGDSELTIPPAMDTNGDNVLTKEELINYISQVVSQDVPQERIDSAFLQMDSNGNGVLEFNEIKSMISAK